MTPEHMRDISNQHTICVGHLKGRYLALTETFIYSFLCHTPRVQPLVLTNVARHLDAFPIACSYLAQEYELKKNWNVSRMVQQMDYPTCFERLIRERNLVVLHAHFGQEGIGALVLKHRLGLPLITSFYGVDASKMFRSRRLQTGFRHLFQSGDVFTVLGTDMKRRLCAAGCPEEKIHIVHLGVDTEQFGFQTRSWPQKGTPVRLLFCGRLVEKKGVLDALNAFAKLATQWPDLEFRIVGEGPMRPALTRLIQRFHLQNRVVLRGAVSHREVQKEMKQAHVFVLPSKTASDGDMEGTPTVLMEAQALGLPVVSTHHADIPEVVLDGQSGFLVAERDCEGLATCLNDLLAHPALWPAMGQAGRAHIERHYNIHSEALKLRTLYEACTPCASSA